MATNRVRLYHKETGEPVDFWSVDAAEALAAGSYSVTPPPKQRGMDFPEPPGEPEAPAAQVEVVETVVAASAEPTTTTTPGTARRRGH